MTPIESQVAIRPDKADTKVGEFELPASAQVAPKRGTVIAVGPGTYATATGVHIPMQVKVGDVIDYSKYAGTEIDLDGEKVVIIQQAQCLLIH